MGLFGKKRPSKFEALLFDLDGTLIQVEMQSFIPAYLRDLAGYFRDRVEPERFVGVARKAVHALLQGGDKQRTNRERYLAFIETHLDIPGNLFEERLNDWVEQEMEELAGHVTSVAAARPLLDYCFGLGIPVALATNPVFPAAMVEARVEWAGLGDYPFSQVTSYENTRYCKPHKAYYSDLLELIGARANRCLMVGNDTMHDLAAAEIGMPTFLADTFLIDRLDGDYASDYRGSLEDLLDLLRERF
jgi:FMN phosphatase YigB (HAD superfamily)